MVVMVVYEMPLNTVCLIVTGKHLLRNMYLYTLSKNIDKFYKKNWMFSHLNALLRVPIFLSGQNGWKSLKK